MVLGSRVFRELPSGLVHKAFGFLDDLWDATQFVPCPLGLLMGKFNSGIYTQTQALIVILAWQEMRLRKG